MTPVVTICDRRYLPGLAALHNSFLRHSADGFEFWAVLAGDEAFADEVRKIGINVILNPAFPSDVFPTSWRYPKPMPISYWRLMVPKLFPGHEKSIYIDTDSLILRSLQPLVDRPFTQPVAATESNSPISMEYGKPGRRDTGKHGPRGPMSSLYVFNHEAWREKRVLERCVEAMQRTDVEFYTLSQGLLQFVLGDDWHVLPWRTQAHAGHDTFWVGDRADVYTLHFMGVNPWDEYPAHIEPTERKLEARALWQIYA